MTELAAARPGLADFPREQLLRQAEEEGIVALSALEQLDQCAEDASPVEVTARATEAIAAELRALRYALMATIAPHELEPPINTWAKIELFGHQRLTGHVTETRIAGKRFLKVTVPETSRDRHGTTETIPASSKLYSPNAVYALTECTEEQALTDIQEDIPF